jgi:type I restriction enzyme S subunit
MKSNYEPLGKHIRLVDYRNSEEVTSTVLGISIDKEFMPSVANVIGTDLSRYKLISKGLFACNPMHVGRDERLPIALYEKDNAAIVSPAYFMFEIIDRDVLNEEYLMMWFRRPEFDRECWFMTDGSVRGGITWDDLCRIKLPVPSYARQCEIVESYRAITNRIALKRAENDNLRATAETEFFRLIRYPQIQEVPSQDTEIGVYPSDWILTTLGQVLSTIIDRRGLTPTKLGGEWSPDGIIAISAKSVKNHELINLDIANRVDRELYERWMPQKLQPHDILMTSEAPLGEFYFIADFSEYCLSQRLFAMRANTEIVEPTVLYFQLTDSIGKHQIDIRKTGTTVTGIRQSELVQVPVILPPKQVQQSFARFCNPIMLSIERNSAEIRALSKVKTMILAQLSSR